MKKKRKNKKPRNPFKKGMSSETINRVARYKYAQRWAGFHSL
jgi:hypothetical protein